MTAKIYLAPISPKGWFTWWKGQHSGWKSGYVVRFLWFGLLARWGRNNVPKNSRNDLTRMMLEANDEMRFALALYDILHK